MISVRRWGEGGDAKISRPICFRRRKCYLSGRIKGYLLRRKLGIYWHLGYVRTIPLW